ncbi:beta-galactosidase GalA [Roseateles sp.]|uniref:beta-galactosidase GalA n=1 Tax=Roseateles sp. TaxID=1971397 RepID=UPI002E09C4EB|nr:beta-galactosidase GalA [Roseateles sp.]HEV6964670.1 beta-galactosidase GalA [Roseateles sp.]
MNRLLALAFLTLSLAASVRAAPLRETLSLDEGWRFHLGDIRRESFPGGQGVNLYGPDITYHGAKAGSAWGAAARGYDDSGWKRVDLPHDWVVEQPFDEKALKQQGYRPRGIGWYRRTFKLSPADRGKNLELQLDGAATHATVYFNGSEVQHNWSGYSSMYVNLTPMARYGDDINTIAVRVDAADTEGWWYEGGGLYRHTWLVKRSPLHIATDGVHANPVKAADGQWVIPAEVTLANTGPEVASARVEVAVFDAAGQRVAGGSSAAVSVVPQGEALAKLTVRVAAPRLWSIDAPNLYTVRTTVLRDGKPVDAVDTTVGFRTIRFDAKQGFLLNGQPLKLKGTSNHQDHAGVGVAMPDSLWEFRLRKLKEMGSNAYRTAHNPPAKELLDAADRLGMLVMDETRHFNASTEYLQQLRWLVRRDRNHPSVILWSLFNEEGLQGTEEGMEMARVMNAVVKQLDATRPTTGAQNKGHLGPDGKANPKNAAQVLDVVGINYEADLYDKIRAAYPDKPIVSTEDTSQVMTRGEYATDWKQVVASYDEVFPGWAATSSARNSWEAIMKQTSFAGGFSWTGFAYRGEPTPYGWPSASSHFGALDLCGFPKTEFYVRQAMFVKDRPVLTLVPHWNWQGKEGQNIKVLAATNADTVALSLNGRLVEEKKVHPFQMVDWQVPYAPGRLEAVAKKDGREVARYAVETTGSPVALRLTPDRDSLAGDGRDAAPVTVEAVDAQGRPVPNANLAVELEVSGPGANIGVGNGDPNSHDPEKGDKVRIYNGLAQVILQSRRAGSGELVLRATAAGLQPAQASIKVRAVPALAAVPVLAP